MQPLALSEAEHIFQTLQVPFDRMLYDVLEKYHSFPGFTLLLESICQYMSAKQPFDAGMAALSYLIQKQEGCIPDNTGFFGGSGVISQAQHPYLPPGTPEFLSYFTELLENPERSGTHLFDQERYAMAAKKCLKLYLCNHHMFSKGATDFAFCNEAMQRSIPWEWVARLGVHSRIRKGWHHFKALQ